MGGGGLLTSGGGALSRINSLLPPGASGGDKLSSQPTVFEPSIFEDRIRRAASKVANADGDAGGNSSSSSTAAAAAAAAAASAGSDAQPAAAATAATAAVAAAAAGGADAGVTDPLFHTTSSK